MPTAEATEPVIEAISAADLGLGMPDDEQFEDDVEVEASETEEVPRETVGAGAPTVPQKQEDNLDEAPKSWAKDKHEIWKTMSPEAKEVYRIREKQMLDGLEQYKEHNDSGRRFKEVMSPYKDYLRQQNVDEVKAIEYLMSAQYRLSTGDPQTKLTMIKDLARASGLDLDQIYGKSGETQSNSALEPLLNEIKSIKSEQNAWKQAEFNKTRQQVQSAVEKFASDPKNVYFDECADHIAKFIQQGDKLEDAYEKAVWANPVTRAKELARIQTESVEKLKPKLKDEANRARKASGSNVRSRDTGRTPTEPLGTMEDTMRETLAKIKAGIH